MENFALFLKRWSQRKGRCTKWQVRHPLLFMIWIDTVTRSSRLALTHTHNTRFYSTGVVTSKGSARQCVHPDLPFQSKAPLYVVFLALQDVTTTMGPTTFLLGTNTEEARNAYDDDISVMDSLISNCEIRETTMAMGDLVVFDARTMHCGNANVGSDGTSPDRALFNFSFQNPSVTGSLGYKGSMRPHYTSQGINLGDVLNIVDGKSNSETAPFAQYGNGLVR
jgi:ectoine hydroxylase-related dioxygenase (phytanoyl-CoA dioxygenase family)